MRAEVGGHGPNHEGLSTDNGRLMQTPDLARTLRTMLALALVSSLLGLVLSAIFLDRVSFVVSTVALFSLAPLWFTFVRGHVLASALGLVLLLNGLTVYALLDGGGIQDPTVILFPLVIVVSGILLARRIFLSLSLLVIASCLTVGLLEIHGLVHTRLGHLLKLSDVVFTIFLLSVVVAVVDVLSHAVRDSIHRKLISEQSYRQMFDATGVGVFLVDPLTSRVVDVNHATLSIFGIDSKDQELFSLETLAGADEKFGFEELSRTIREASVAPLQLEWEVEGPSGRCIWLELGARAGEIQGKQRVICVLRDVTERRQLRQQIEQSERLRSVGLLARGVAHDFNNQLTGIMANSSLLEAGLPPHSPLAELNEAIMACSQRSADLTQQLLAFARQGQSRSVVVEMNGLVEDVCTLLRRSIQKKIEVVHIPGKSALHILGDLSFLQNAILNLGLNARDAMSDGGKLEFEVSEAKDDKSWVVIRVSDTGTGIRPEFLDRIFDPFFTTKVEGNGMGLAAVYGTVESHGGSISVSSKEGKGTSFFLRFRRTEGTQVAEAVPEDDSQVNFNGLRVLLAEDDPFIAKIAQKLLIALGCTVTHCSDGQLALDKLGEEGAVFQLAILDNNMPLVNGDEVLSMIRREHLTMRVISTSGFTEASSLSTEARPDAFLPKPFTRQALVRVLRRVLDHDDGKETIGRIP